MFNRDKFKQDLIQLYPNLAVIADELADIGQILPSSINNNFASVIEELNYFFYNFQQSQSEVNYLEIISNNLAKYKQIINLAAEAANTYQALVTKYEKYNNDFNNNIDNIVNNVRNLVVLKANKINIEDDYLIDFFAISNLLINKERCYEIMTLLEMDLQKYARDKSANLEDYSCDLKKLPHDEEHPLNKQKILSGFLYQWARYNGFNKEKYAKATGLLSRTSFFSLLHDKVIFKDKGVDYSHGVWPHVLQQYLIKKGDEKYRFLINHTPADLYSYLGNEKFNANEDDDDDLTAWEIFLDRQTNMKFDFGSPEFITSELKSDAKNIDSGTANFPLLSESVSRYEEKPGEILGKLKKGEIDYRFYNDEASKEKSTSTNIDENIKKPNPNRT